MPRNIAVRVLVGHTLVCESELDVIVDKSVLADQDKTFATLFLRVGYAEVQPGQILSILCQTDSPPQRDRMTAEKVLAIYAFRALKSSVFWDFSGMVTGVVG